MKNLLNNSLNHGAFCSLCQDTLLRHISQSRIFWYCPSCRQEMVGEKQKDLPKTAVRVVKAAPQRHLPKVSDPSRRIGVQAHY